MAHDFSDAPDGHVITPDRCGLTLTVGSTAFDCGVVGTHTTHLAIHPGMSRRTELGFGDVQAAEVRLEWVDDRRNATVGDVRALIRQGQTTDTEENR